MIAAKTNMDEFAMGSSTEHSAFGRVKHPARSRRGCRAAPRGGSAALVAAGVVPAALGSETGGSVRQPASFCGVVGMKPSYGRVSRYGLVAFGSSLDCISVFGRTVDDAGRVLSVMSGHDPLDATTRGPPADGRCPRRCRISRVSRIGLPARVLPRGSPPRRRGRASSAPRERDRASSAAEVREVSLPHSPLRGPDLLHRGAGRGRGEPRPVRRRALRPAEGRPRGRHPRALPGHAGRGLRRRGAAPDPGGHLRAERRLLRRLLPEGAAGAGAHRRRLPAGLRLRRGPAAHARPRPRRPSRRARRPRIRSRCTSPTSSSAPSAWPACRR